MIAWIKTIQPDKATGALSSAYEDAMTPHGTIDNVMKAHSLRPHTMRGHIALYGAVLNHPENALPEWFLEAVGTYTSILNGCEYSLEHHSHNARVLLGGAGKGDEAVAALEESKPEKAFSGKYLALLNYVEKLTVDVANIEESDFTALRDAGADDGEILETNQVCGYFNYINRHLNGLGVSTEGDVIGRYT